jgi:hypothetical protein
MDFSLIEEVKKEVEAKPPGRGGLLQISEAD